MSDSQKNALGAKFSSNTFYHYTPMWFIELANELYSYSPTYNGFFDLASDNVANSLLAARGYFSQGFPGRKLPEDEKHAFLNPYGGMTGGKSSAMVQWDELMRMWLTDEIESGIFLAFNYNQVALGGYHKMNFFPRINFGRRFRFLRCEFDLDNWERAYKRRFKEAKKTNHLLTDDIRKFIQMDLDRIKRSASQSNFWVPQWNKELQIYYSANGTKNNEIAVKHIGDNAWYFPQGSPPHHSSLIYLPPKDTWQDAVRHFLNTSKRWDLEDSIVVNFPKEMGNTNYSLADNILNNLM